MVDVKPATDEQIEITRKIAIQHPDNHNARGALHLIARIDALRAQVAALQAREGRLMAMAVEARRHMASVNEESPAVEAVCVILERMQVRAP